MLKALARLEIVEGLLIALEDIDNVINMIKKSENASAAQESLMAAYHLNDRQVKAILDMKLARLAKLEKIELQNEKAELIKKIDELDALINNYGLQKIELKNRLNEIVKKFGDARRTELTHIDIKPEEKEIEEVIPEDCVVILSQAGDIKRVPSKSFKIQRKNGKGVKTEDDAILNTISTNTIDTLMAFTNKGKMFRLLVDNIPTGTNASKGVRIGTLINMEIDEKDMYFDSEIEYEPVYTFGSNVVDNISKMMHVEELCKKFPGLDCGSCGAPSCKALAEDIVRGQAKEKDCIHVLRQFINRFSDEINS